MLFGRLLTIYYDELILPWNYSETAPSPVELPDVINILHYSFASDIGLRGIGIVHLRDADGVAFVNSVNEFCHVLVKAVCSCHV